jgi:hypothetical protein
MKIENKARFYDVANTLISMCADAYVGKRMDELDIVRKLAGDFTTAVQGTRVTYTVTKDGDKTVTYPTEIVIYKKCRLLDAPMRDFIREVAECYYRAPWSENNHAFADQLYGILEALSEGTAAFDIDWWADDSGEGSHDPQMYINFVDEF